MSTTFIGIDLAWQSERNHSGIVVATGDDSGAVAHTMSSGVASLVAVVKFVSSHASENTVVAIDAPLIIRNASGQRPCETEIGRRFGAKHASAHSTNLTKYPEAPPCKLVAMLESEGFIHEPRPHTSGARDGRWIFEVYPHPAMINVFNLGSIIRYKKGRVTEKKGGLEHLRTYLAGLRSFDPPFSSSDDVERLFSEVVASLRGKPLKAYEDLLDAYFCAYLAFHYWHFGAQRNEMIGDTDTGYIMVPR